MLITNVGAHSRRFDTAKRHVRREEAAPPARLTSDLGLTVSPADEAALRCEEAERLGKAIERLSDH
jgi:hypothetical protein